jgi:hypothetical protein
MTTVESRHLFDLSMELHPIFDLGDTPAGGRRIVPVAGGRFSGGRLNGEVLPVCGSDLLLARADGSYQQDVRLALRTENGEFILMTYRGVRTSSREVAARLAAGETVAPTEYYLRIAPFFETSAPNLQWLNAIVAIGYGERGANGVSYRVHEIL